jgi:hypothetical protein
MVGLLVSTMFQPWNRGSQMPCVALATGGGFAARMLHTDREMITFEGQRPVLLNGIPLLTARPDSADRSVTVRRRTLVPESRNREDSLWAYFDTARPRILGAIFTAVSAAIRNIGKVKRGGKSREVGRVHRSPPQYPRRPPTRQACISADKPCA